jgi:diaminopimelate epimerase
MAVSSGISPLQYSLDVGDKNYRFITSLSTGSTHTVIFVDELPENDEFHTISPQIEHHPYFPERTTVLWTRVLSPNQVQLRIWERGVGETLACGTGACAAAVATHINGRGDATQGIRVYSKGGELHIRWQEGSEIHKTGPAEIVYTGTWIANEE